MTTHREGRLDVAVELMEVFARSTGLTSDERPRRYLWTDAFAVCNWLGLYDETGESRFRTLALELVDQVHGILGRHRPDDPRRGWISGLSEDEGARHPTAGGLRIGKPLPERLPGEAAHPRTEWDRDGQYYHYLTRWMHALNRAWHVTRNPAYHGWAGELAEAAHRGFLAIRSGERRLHWKMSVDLSRPLVPSSGQHDPLDGWLTVSELVEAAPAGSAVEAGSLERVARDLWGMCQGGIWATDDPLGAGGLLVDAYRCRRLLGYRGFPREELCDVLLEDAAASLDAVVASKILERPTGWRLAFRELGLSIGVRASERLLAEGGPEAQPAGEAGGVPAPGETGDTGGVPRRIRQRLERHGALAEAIERFWMDEANRRAEGWRGHLDISRVMMATSLAPGGYLG